MVAGDAEYLIAQRAKHLTAANVQNYRLRGRSVFHLRGNTVLQAICPIGIFGVRRARFALLSRLIVEVGTEPTLDFGQAHSLPLVVIGDLVSIDLAKRKVA